MEWLNYDYKGAFFDALIARSWWPKQFKPDHYILLYGMHWSGKSSVWHKFKHGEKGETRCFSITMDWEQIELQKMTLTFKDIGCCHQLKTLYSQIHTFSTRGLVFVIDSTDREMLFHPEPHRIKNPCVHTTDLFQSIQRQYQTKTPLLIFANKQDQRNPMRLDEIVLGLELNKVERPWHIQPCSAETGEGLHEGFNWLSDAIEQIDRGCKPSRVPVPLSDDEMYLRVFLGDILGTPFCDSCGWIAHSTYRMVFLHTDADLVGQGGIQNRETILSELLLVVQMTPIEFIRLFETDNLHSWGHEDMIQAIFSYLTHFPRRIAIEKIFEEFARVQGDGYHLTLTYFWIQMTELRRREFTRFAEFWGAKKSEIGNVFLWKEYFSDGLINDPMSAAEMRFPDKKQIRNIL